MSCLWELVAANETIRILEMLSPSETATPYVTPSVFILPIG